MTTESVLPSVAVHIRLSDRLGGKENNLNLVRFVAAFAVLVSHSFVLSSGNSLDEPLRGLLGMSLGDLAVDIFFAASGFLVTRSLVERGNGIEFLWARLLRIHPALIVMLVATVLLAPFFGAEPLSDLVRHRETFRYFIKNLVLVRGVEFSLSGMFSSAPWKCVVNGSLWTMTYELRLYLSLLVLWWPLGFFPRHRKFLFKAACVGIAVFALGWEIATLFLLKPEIVGQIDPVPRLVLMFYSGAVWWIASRRVVLDGRVLVGSGVLIAATWWMGGQLLAQLLVSLWIPYAVWWLAFVPRGRLLAFNRIGDASYGIYIYAFPLQQMWIVTFPGRGPWEMMGWVGSATIGLGFLSWHLLEKRALSLKTLPARLHPRLSRV